MQGQKVFLIGYMASGKSTLGKELSQKLNCPFVDLDNKVEEQIKGVLKRRLKNMVSFISENKSMKL